MKIGFDGRFIRRIQTGDGVFSQKLIEGLSRLDHENSYTIYLLEDYRFLAKSNFQLKCMPQIHSNSHARFLLSFPWELFRQPVDIFHAVHTVPLKTFSPTVLHLVEFGWVTNPREFPVSRLLLAEIRQIVRRSIDRADCIITGTHRWKERLLNHFDVGEEKVVVIPHGFNEGFLSRCTREEIERTKQKYKVHGDYILNAGNLHPRKNIVRLIEAFCWLKETRGIPHRLVLVGKPLYRAEEIYEKAAASSVSDSIMFTGYLPFEDLRAFYQGASAYAFPSLEEGFGLPVHEAMASEIPVVVSNRGALPEVAGDAALVVNPLDIEEIGCAIYRLLDDTALRQDLISKGLRQIQRFTWDESSRALLRVYASLGNGRSYREER